MPQPAQSPAQSRNQPDAGQPKKGGKRGLIVLAVLAVLAGLAFAAFKYPGFLVKETRPDYSFYVRPSFGPSASPSAVPAAVPRETDSGKVSAENNAVTLCGVTVDVDPSMLFSGTRTVSVSVYEGGAEDGAAYDLYELKMDSGGVLMIIEIVSEYTKTPVSSLEVDYRVLN